MKDPTNYLIGVTCKHCDEPFTTTDRYEVPGDDEQLIVTPWCPHCGRRRSYSGDELRFVLD